MIKYKLVDKILDNHHEMAHHKLYPNAHRIACKAEKEKYPEGYETLKRLERYWPKNEWMGMNALDGSIEVSKEVPEKFREEVAFHEYTEHKAFMQLFKLHGYSTKTGEKL